MQHIKYSLAFLFCSKLFNWPVLYMQHIKYSLAFLFCSKLFNWPVLYMQHIKYSLAFLEESLFLFLVTVKTKTFIYK